ncbi:hypothetical protein HZA97_04820 [Candidatus Woesearchaeota archaeon]|nr:hypothetical protein [Candidatus Woesearchaeota archaeon]
MAIGELEETLGEITITRSADEIVINRKNTNYPNYRSLTAYYSPRKRELRIHDFNMNREALFLFDSDDDGKVEMFLLDFEPHNRRNTPEEFLNADQKLADYKALLNFDAIIAEELKKQHKL